MRSWIELLDFASFRARDSIIALRDEIMKNSCVVRVPRKRHPPWSQLVVVASAVWANAISARGAHPGLSILLLNDESEQCFITI
jgi:hypothetical protein